MNALFVVPAPYGLARFTTSEDRPGRDRLAAGLTGGLLALVLGLGWILATVSVPVLRLDHEPARTQIRVRLEAPTTVAALPPVPVAPEIPHLEPQAILAAPVERKAAPAHAAAAPMETAPAETAPAAAPARRVYGVRKVYAKGLGAGAAGAGGLVGKLGNSLGGAPDSLTATAADLQGALAALSTVDQAPEPLRRVKPDYSPTMRQARAEGVVTAYLLVDSDGSVKDVKVTEDIGHDSAAVAAAALGKFTFRPARKHGQPVAVWILHRIRFEFQE